MTWLIVIYLVVGFSLYFAATKMGYKRTGSRLAELVAILSWPVRVVAALFSDHEKYTPHRERNFEYQG